MTIAHGDTATLSVMSAAVPQRHRRRARGVGNVLRSHARDLRRRSILQLDGGKQQDRGVARDRHLRRLHAGDEVRGKVGVEQLHGREERRVLRREGPQGQTEPVGG